MRYEDGGWCSAARTDQLSAASRLAGDPMPICWGRCELIFSLAALWE